MTAPVAHDRLIHRYSLRGQLVCTSALAIGAGAASAEASASDLPLARDGAGRPYVPGSSLRGSWRSALESLLRGLDRDDLHVCDPFETAPDNRLRRCSDKVQDDRKRLSPESPLTEEMAFDLAWKHSCAICQLFGHLFLASRVRIADLPLIAEARDAGVYVRDGVGLDRDLRTAARGVLYNFEAVAAGARFELRIDTENTSPAEMGLLLIGLDLFGEGMARLGGKSARGLGLVSVTDLEVTRRTAADFFTGREGTRLTSDDLSGFREAAHQHYVGEVS